MVSISHIPFSSSTLALLFILSALISLNHASKPYKPLAIPSFLKSGMLSTLSPATKPLSGIPDSEHLASSIQKSRSITTQFEIQPTSKPLSGIPDNEPLASSKQEPKSSTIKFDILPVSEPYRPDSETLASSTWEAGNLRIVPSVRINPMLVRSCGNKAPCLPKLSSRKLEG